MKNSNRHHSKKRVLLPEIKEKANLGFAPISAEKRKHLKNVLRLENGAELMVTDGYGALYEATLDYGKNESAIVLNQKILQTPKPPETILCICLPKNSTMDWVVEKSVECEATKIIPVVSSRSVVKPDPKELSKYVTRWQATMDAAVEQSERTWRPEIVAPTLWQDFLKDELAQNITNQLLFSFVSELRADENKATIEETCNRLKKAFSINPSAKTFILVGPEGGFSPQEREQSVLAGFQELCLGPVVLRVETAVISALTLIRAGRSCFGEAS